LKVHRLNALAPHVRRLASKGWTTDAILRVYPQLSRSDVRSILSPPPARGPRPRAVRAGRPRPASPSGEWWFGPAWRDDDDPYLVGLWERLRAAIEARLPPPAPAATSPEAARERWDPGVDARTGGEASAAKLSDDDAALIRELRAVGVPRQDLAGWFRVSVATITRITRGETYPDARRAELDQVVTIEPPPVVAEEFPGETWPDPPRRAGLEWRDDGPGLPAPELPAAPPAAPPARPVNPTVWTEPASLDRAWRDD
jgi:hypothetical protein